MPFSRVPHGWARLRRRFSENGIHESDELYDEYCGASRSARRSVARRMVMSVVWSKSLMRCVRAVRGA
mgnify:CR=1 FL=1|jgi:hypothetical protein